MTNRWPARDRPGALGRRRGSWYRGSRVMPVEGRDLSSMTDAIRSEGPGDWATYQLRKVFRNCRWRCTRKRRPKPAIASTPCTTIYGRLPPQDDSAGVDGIGCTNLSGLLMERFTLLDLDGDPLLLAS